MQADLGTLHLLVYWVVFSMSWATNQSLYKIHSERGGCMAVPSGHRRLTGVDTITMSISSCASGDTIYTHTLSLGACFPHQSQGTRTLWWDSFGAIKKLKRVWKKEAQVLKNSLHAAALWFTPISAVVTAHRLQKKLTVEIKFQTKLRWDTSYIKN